MVHGVRERLVSAWNSLPWSARRLAVCFPDLLTSQASEDSCCILVDLDRPYLDQYPGGPAC